MASQSDRPFSAFPKHTNSEVPSDGPLNGIKVVDFSHFIAGPFCTMVLGDMGAEIIKIESAKGDDVRAFPPSDPLLDGQGSPFLWANRNKKSIVLNLKSKEGIAVVHDLVRAADVVVENFSTGVMERLGLAYDDLKKINENLIFCSISAYGRTGAFADRLGFDTVVQAESGFMSFNGYPDRDGTRVQPVVMDTSTALMSSNAIIAALFNRERNGGGQRIDVSLYETSLNMLGYGAMQYLMNGIKPTRIGNSSNDTAPTGLFHTSDSSFFVSSSNTVIFQRIFQVIGRDDVAQDPKLQDRVGRLAHREEMAAILQEAFGKHTWSYWEPKLRKANVPAGEMRTLPDAFHSDVTRELGLVTRIEHPTAGEVPNIALPIRFSETPMVDPVAAPTIGQHTRDVLENTLGYTAEQISTLEASDGLGAFELPKND